MVADFDSSSAKVGSKLANIEQATAKLWSNIFEFWPEFGQPRTTWGGGTMMFWSAY